MDRPWRVIFEHFHRQVLLEEKRKRCKALPLISEIVGPLAVMHPEAPNQKLDQERQVLNQKSLSCAWQKQA
jgi:hypothetical protein